MRKQLFLAAVASFAARSASFVALRASWFRLHGFQAQRLALLLKDDGRYALPAGTSGYSLITLARPQ